MDAIRLVLAGLALLLAACARAPSKADPTRPSAAPPREEWSERYTHVDMPDAGVAVEVPVAWYRFEPAWAWSPYESAVPRVGVWWQDVQPPVEIEAAMLPQNSVILESEPVELDWASARWYTVEVYAAPDSGQGSEPTPTIRAVETHVLIVIPQQSQRRVLDLYGSARQAEELLTLRPVLEHMVTSATLLQ
jgi:hypothetical protein